MLVIGHRGASGYAPENTFAAFDRALGLGADGVETDIRLTRDGVLVLLHDNTVDRTTDGRGHLADMTWSEVQKLDAGGWYGATYAGQRLPSLEELLDRYVGRLQLVLELKTADAARPLVELLQRRDLPDHPGLRIIGFSWTTVALIAHALTRLTTGYLTFHLNESLIKQLAESPVREVWPEIAAIRPSLVETAHTTGVKVGTWGIRSHGDIARARDARVDALALDYPDWAIAKAENSPLDTIVLKKNPPNGGKT